MMWTIPSVANDYLRPHVDLLLGSFAHWLRRLLLEPGLSPEDPARRLFHAPFAVLSHNTLPDPVFNYANQTALTLFELTWGELVAMPSRLSAEPLHQDERARLLATVARQGYIDDYSGVRIAKSGRRFRIERAIVWNLLDEHGDYRGQAAMFDYWRPL